MTYASVDDLKAVLPARDLLLLTDQSGDLDAVDDAKLIAALEDATAEVNGYIAKRVTLPLSNPPRMLAVVCRDLAVHRLYANIGQITEAAKANRESAERYLKAVAKGELSIGDETAGDVELTSPGVVFDEGPDRVMTRDSLKAY